MSEADVLESFQIVRKQAINVTMQQSTLDTLDALVEKVRKVKPTANRSLVVEHLLLKAMAATQ